LKILRIIETYYIKEKKCGISLGFWELVWRVYWESSMGYGWRFMMILRNEK
jgi:hypothetical protein